MMASAVDSTALNDDETTSNTLKRRRSSGLISNDFDIEQTPSKRACSSSITFNSIPSDTTNHFQSMYSSLNEIIQSHRFLLREYLDLQSTNSFDEQTFLQNEEDLIDKVEKNFHDISQIPSTPPSSSRHGKRQRYQSISSTNQSFDRVKHETHILKRIEELKSDGKWTNQRLAKCLEPNKRKTHWDYLLDEMRWLAEDFQLEKRWKQAMAKKISQAVLKYFHDKDLHYLQEQARRRQAKFICYEVMNFWRQISRLAHDRRCLSIDSNIDDDDEQTIEHEEQFERDEYDFNELKYLENDRNQPIDSILQTHYGIDLSTELSSTSKSLSIETDEELELFLNHLQSYQPNGVHFQSNPPVNPVSFLFKSSLREYQHIAFDWLVKLFDENLHCILADENGLGKTVESIALLTYLAGSQGNWGPHLIVTSNDCLEHWENELIRFSPSLKIFFYFNSSFQYEDLTKLVDFHVCITSSQLFYRDINRFRCTKWNTIVYDQINLIQQFPIDCQHCLIINNQYSTNYSLEFLLPNIEFASRFRQDKNLVERIIRLLTLRRLKIDVEQQLPTINEYVYRCDLSRRQKYLYQQQQQQYRNQLTVENFLRLKQISNHPNLIEMRPVKSPFVFDSQSIKCQFPKLIMDLNFKNPNFEFNRNDEESFIAFRRQTVLNVTIDLFVKVFNQNQSIEQEKVQITKEIIERYRNTSTWTDNQQAKQNDFSKSLDDECVSRLERLCQINNKRCEYHFIYGSDLLTQIQLALQTCHSFNRTTFSGYSLCQINRQTTSTQILEHLLQLNQYDDVFNRVIFCTKRVLTSPIDTRQSKPLIEILPSQDPIQQEILIDYPSNDLIKYDSGKLRILADLLMNSRRTQQRCVIYCQMFDMLDILERFVRYSKYSYIRIDQQQTNHEINVLIERFNRNKQIFILILTTQIQVNFTGVTDRIIFYDYDWNLQRNQHIRQQCEQIRQRQNLNIYQLISRNTIEEELFEQNESMRNFLTQFQEEILLKEEEEEQIESMDFDNQIEDADSDDESTVQQLRPIERYALRYVKTNRQQYPIGHLSFDTEQFQQDWQMSCWKMLKQQEEKEREQDNDEMFYTYTRDNEQKIWMTEDGQTFVVWCGIITKCSIDQNEEFYNDNELDFGYESEAMLIEPEEYIRFPLPKALADATNMSKSDTNILVPRSLFDRSNLLLNTQSTSLSTNTFNKSKQISNHNNNNKLFPGALATSPSNLKARQLYVNNGPATATALPNNPNANVIVSATAAARPVKLEEILSKDNYQGLLEIDNSDWLISEDYKVLDTIQNIQQLPLSSMSFSSTSNANKPQSILPNTSLTTSPLLPSTTITSPSSSTVIAAPSSSSSMVNNTTNALTQNWDFISDIVNHYSRVLRTPKQCKHRFEQVIGPREEGRVVYDLIKKKKHVIKGTVKMSDDNWQILRTNQLFVHDNCQKLAQIYHQKFETISQFDPQVSSMTYLNKFKQMQLAQAAHHQMKGLRIGTLLQENNINIEKPLTPGDVTYQRTEREKELKQQQQQQQLQQQQQQQQQAQLQAAQAATTTNVHPQQTPTTPNSIDTIKSQTSVSNTPLTPTITTRPRPASLFTAITPTSTSINPSPTTPISLMPTVPSSASSPTAATTFPRTVSNNIIVPSNNHPQIQSNRLKSTILPPRSNISSPTPTSISSIPTSVNPPSISTATIVPGPRQVQVLPTNSLSTNETTIIQPTQVRTLPNQQQTTATTTPPPPLPPSSPSTNRSPTPTNIQVRTPTLQRTSSQTTIIPTLEVRTQLPTSPKPQQTSTRPSSTTARPPSASQSSIDYVIQSQPKTLTTTATTPQSTLPVAVVRSIQNPTSTVITPTVSSSPMPTSPLNLPSMNVTLPSNKITSTNIPQQSRPTTTTTTLLPNSNHSTSQITTISPQIRQLLPTTPSNSQTTTTVINPTTQRLTDTSQRPSNNIQHFVTNRTTTIPGHLRNVRIVTFTPGTSPSTNLSDSTTVNTQQTPMQSANITYNRANSATATFSRSTINHDQDISPDLAAQLQRLKAISGMSNSDTNESTPTPRALFIPAQTISSSSASSVSSINSTSKLKSSAIIDPSTLGLTTKTSQANIVFQLPSSTGGDDQSNSTTNSTGLPRQNLVQHINFIPSTLNQRSQSPTATAAIARFLQQCQIRTAANPSNTQISSIRQAANEQQTSSSSSSSSPPPPPAPPSSSTT